jgi:hypothetical protein
MGDIGAVFFVQAVFCIVLAIIARPTPRKAPGEAARPQALRIALVILVLANVGLGVRAFILGRTFPDQSMTQCCEARDRYVELGALVERPELVGDPSPASDTWLCERLLARLEEYSLDVGRTMAVIFGPHAATFGVLAVVSWTGQRRVRGRVPSDRGEE